VTKVFFYPHQTFRDRQLDTIRRWPPSEIVNLELLNSRRGTQVDIKYANAPKLKLAWKQLLPLVNIKLRPKTATRDSVVYVWGSIIATGDFIVDLDNPWSLVGYNLRAMPIYRWLLKRILLSKRCREIRCMSEACRKSLGALFGIPVFEKAKVHYPCISQAVDSVGKTSGETCRFLFVGTQFEIKGGEVLLKAFRRVHDRHKGCHLDVITHLPADFSALAEGCKGITIHQASFSRDEIHTRFMQNADILVLPTYVESFGMVALEALANGLALIATDVYALKELVEDGANGNLLIPPISIWDGVMPSAAYFDLPNIKQRIRATDTRPFELQLEEAIERFAIDPDWRLRARQNSAKLMTERFAC
jgi:glycosyltransferase involved in cell wall biosynthesis